MMPHQPDPEVLSEAALELGNLWSSRRRGYRAWTEQRQADETCEELLRLGYTTEQIRASILDEGRKRTEALWQWEKRFTDTIKPEVVRPDGEIDVVLEAWARFCAAYKLEFKSEVPPDWRTDRIFRSATEDGLMEAIRIVRADPKNKFSASKFHLMHAALKRVRQTPAAMKRPAPMPPGEKMPSGFSMIEATRRMREAQASDPNVNVSEILQAYKDEFTRAK